MCAEVDTICLEAFDFSNFKLKAVPENFNNDWLVSRNFALEDYKTIELFLYNVVHESHQKKMTTACLYKNGGHTFHY